MIPRGDQKPKDLGSRTVAPDGKPDEKQPKWRHDFPIDWSKDDYVSRRDLVKFMVLTSAAFAVGQSWMAVKSLFGRRETVSTAVAIATVDELAIGEAKTFHYPANSTPRLLVRTGASSFVAYDQQCTHLMCPVVPAVKKGALHCPCHNGWFDLQTGRPTAGPPRRPLRRIYLEVKNGVVYATGVQEATL